MHRSVFFRRVARLEFDDAMAWYNSKQLGLGAELKEEVDEWLARIASDPERFPKSRGDIRRAVLRRFPYTIHFLAESRRIVVLAVFHASRNPCHLEGRF